MVGNGDAIRLQVRTEEHLAISGVPRADLVDFANTTLVATKGAEVREDFLRVLEGVQFKPVEGKGEVCFNTSLARAFSAETVRSSVRLAFFDFVRGRNKAR